MTEGPGKKLKAESGKRKLRSTNISAFGSRHFCFGLVNRKERWGLSWKGWLLVMAVGLVSSGVLSLCVYPFLAITHRASTHVLVVEGWVHPYAIEAAVEEFRSGSYERVFTTGGPVSGAGGFVNDFQTSASVGAERLQARGVPAESLQMVPTRVLDRDRTYASAIALRDWFHAHNSHPQAINVLTEGPHARRTRLLFQKALGPDVKVGVIGVTSPDFDPTRWWRYSEGVKDVFSEAIAYLYAKIIFHPVPTEE